MKIYTTSKDINGRTTVGVVLLGDKDQIYLMTGMQLETKDLVAGHAFGIKRALGFVKMNKPLYAVENVEYHHDLNDLENVEKLSKMVENDEFVQRFTNSRNITISQALNNSELDNQMMMIANHQINYYNYFPAKTLEKDR